jgi:YesN/AraC family two-component response regulator
VIKVLVAEDEPPIMRAIIAAIEQSNPKFKVVATAINGKKAIEELKKQCIDVVFTDIRMPVMDGLTLSEHIKNSYPDSICVLISGFQDFEYAKKAIESKVYDYLLKPISNEKLAELLMHLENEIEQKRNKKKRDMMSNVMIESSTGFVDSQCVVLLVYAGAMLMYGNDILVPAIAFWNKITLENSIANILNQREEYMVFYGNNVSERIIVVESAYSENAKEIAENLFKELTKTNEITITLAWIDQINLSEAGQSFHKLREGISRNIILPKSQMLYYKQLDKLQEDRNIGYTKQQIEKMAQWVEVGEFDQVKQYMIEIFEIMNGYNATQQEITTFLDRIVNLYYFQSECVDMKEKVIKKEIYGAIANFMDYRSLAEDVVSILSTLKNQKKVQNEKQPKLIENIENYLIKNYNSSITSTVLSKEFGFVPSYISRLFRQYKGVSPSEYLTHYRIEKAKQIMRESPELLVKEIADQVGFKEAYYFSKTFKKETGLWPSDYHD